MVRRRGGKRSVLLKLFNTLLLLLNCFNDLHAVKIVKVVVPEIIRYGVQDSVVLDCNYILSNNSAGLVVKWFFRNKTQLIYQWIPSHRPQDLGILRNRIDLSYKASNDPLKIHRALRIVKLNTDISGDYTCVVSTFMAEDQRTRRMTVFVPEVHFRLNQNKSDDDTVNVSCEAEGVFPAPNLTLATPERLLDGVTKDLKMVNGRYSAVASVTLRDEDLPSPTEFICTLGIAQAKYAVRKEAVYFPGPISTTTERPKAAVGSNGPNMYVAITIVIVTLPTLTRTLGL